jgi:signal transduction histidine kinase
MDPSAAQRSNEGARTEIRRRTAIAAAIWLVTLGLVALTIYTDDPITTPWRIAADVAVGLGFVVAAVTSRGRVQMRALMVAVGWSWLLSSLPTVPASLHQALLAVSLLVFPSGRISKPVHWIFIMLAVPLALGFSSQPAMALYFLAASIVVVATTPGRPPWVWFPVVSCLALALVVGGLWFAARLDPGDFDPRTGLLIYQLVLIAISIGYAVASRTASKLASRFTDVLLGEGEATGIDGLRAVLAATLHDPSLQIHLWQEKVSAYANPSSSRADPSRPNRFEVTDSGHPVAMVVHNSPSLDDEAIRESVATAIRMTLTNERLISELDYQTRALTNARSRLMTAVDEVRETTASQLQGGVQVRLERAVERLSGAAGSVDDAEANSALSVALDEIKAANSDITSLGAGLVPSAVGRGGIVPAIGDLAAWSPIPVITRLPEEFVSNAEVENTLYYVVSEAITNAIKHSRASRIEVTMMEEGGDIALSVTDDGRGGADPVGSGLLGLADRVAARGGRLRVDSPTGAGTVITAVIPSRSSPTA